MPAIWWLLEVAVALLLPALLVVPPAPAVAGPAELELLRTYTGSWSGAGTLVGDDGVSSDFRCSLFLRRGNAGKLVLSGTCPLLSAAGTIAFVDPARRYEMALTSSTEFKGTAVGRTVRGQLVFSLKDEATDSSGNLLALDARMAMAGDIIAISFDANFNGDHWRGTLDFTR